MWLPVITSILSCMLLIFSGNVAGRDCVYFNSREVRIEKPFRKSRTFQWEEIRKVDGNFDNAVNLYLLDGTKVLTARLGMVNYDVFCDMIKENMPRKDCQLLSFPYVRSTKMYSTLWLRVLSSGSYGHRHSPDLYGKSGARSSGEQHHTAVSGRAISPRGLRFGLHLSAESSVSCSWS